MKKILIGLAIFLLAIAVIVFVSAASLISIRNTAMALEEKVKAQYTANKSEYDNMWKTFKETAQVAELQSNQFKEAYDGIISGRYNDPSLLFKIIKEDNPKLNTNVYTQLQRVIESGRRSFNNSQKSISDVIREYNTYIRKHFVMNFFFNFRELNPDDYITTSAQTDNAFKTKQDNVIDLTGGK